VGEDGTYNAGRYFVVYNIADLTRAGNVALLVANKESGRHGPLLTAQRLGEFLEPLDLVLGDLSIQRGEITNCFTRDSRASCWASPAARSAAVI
jgi:hypothetical protein